MGNEDGTAVEDKVETGLETDAKWYDGHEAITANADVLTFAQKFADPGAMAKSGFELEKKLGSSYRLPDDLKTLNEEQRADIITKTRTLRNIPESAEAYEITVPDGVERDEPFEAAFKALMHKQGRSQEDVQELANFYTEAIKAGREVANQKLAEKFQTADTNYRIQCGSEYEQKMKETKIARLGLAKDLGCTYRDGEKDENGVELLKSKLDDALDVVDANGNKLGNNPIISQMMNLIHDKLYKQHIPVDGSGSGDGVKDDGVLSPAFYANPTK